MKAFFALFTRLYRFLTGKQAQAAVAKAIEIAPKVIPYLEAAARVFVAVTPTPADDLALAAWEKFRTKYPRLVAEDATASERKLAMLAIAADMIEQRFPGINTNIARMAVEIAYAKYLEMDGAANQ
jgi:hypothetical protein